MGAKPIGLFGFLAATALAALPAAATKKPEGTAMPLWERPVRKGEASAIRALRAYAACLVPAPEAPPLLRTTSGSAEEMAALRALIGGRRQCFSNGQLRMMPYLLRGVIAEKLYPAEAARRPGGLSTASPPESFGAFTARLTAAARDRPDAGGRKILAWHWMAYCAAHRDPAGAAALLRSPSSDPAEVEALRALRPALEACLPREHWVELRAVTIRALLAEALFQRLLAQSWKVGAEPASRWHISHAGSGALFRAYMPSGPDSRPRSAAASGSDLTAFSSSIRRFDLTTGRAGRERSASRRGAISGFATGVGVAASSNEISNIAAFLQVRRVNRAVRARLRGDGRSARKTRREKSSPSRDGEGDQA